MLFSSVPISVLLISATFLSIPVKSLSNAAFILFRSRSGIILPMVTSLLPSAGPQNNVFAAPSLSYFYYRMLTGNYLILFKIYGMERTRNAEYRILWML
jgi:hypothetical protein